jgi:hypothetical protein
MVPPALLFYHALLHAAPLSLPFTEIMSQMKELEERATALKQSNESLLITVKQQEDRITEIATDSSHWERKSASLSKELGADIVIAALDSRSST